MVIAEAAKLRCLAPFGYGATLRLVKVRALVLVLAVLTMACARGHVSARAPGWYVHSVRTSLPPDVAYAYDLRFVDDVAHWRECVSDSACSDRERQRPASEVLGVKRVGRAIVNDSAGRDEIDVLQLTLLARARTGGALRDPRDPGPVNPQATTRSAGAIHPFTDPLPVTAP
ncbi:hypothetical protein [Pendulispora albinea]|uniref:Uncharacterized protein n=1 Tax=Pendulispora albinea TaxID=2741071 RepID=A0ABZ2M754_9BACT